jgi:ABC-type branched-subunit amino acid transport system substrate-binding protein
VVVLLAVTLVSTACGARLSAAQLAAANASNTGGLGNSSGTGSSPNARTTNTTSAGSAGTAGSSGSAATGGGSSATGGGSGGTGGGVGVASASGPVCPNGAAGSGPGVTPSTITIGNVSTVTGPVAGLFTSARLGVQAFVDYQNSIGGVCGRKLTLHSGDDNMEQAQNSTTVQSIAGQVLSFVGNFSAADDGGAAAIAAANVPDIGEAATPARFNLPQNFSPMPQPPGFQTGAYKYFAQKFGPSVIQHMAILEANVGAAQSLGAAQEKVMESLGYKFVYTANSVSPTTTDYGSYIAAMKAAGVQGIVWNATAGQYGAMASQMYADGFTIPFANWGPAAYDPQFTTTAGPGANGAILWQNWAMYEGQDAAAVPEVALFDKWYGQVSGGQAPTLYALFGWLSGMIFVQGINAGGAPTRAALFNGLKTVTNFDGNGLEAPDNPAGKGPPACFLIIDVNNGKFVRDSATPSGFTCGGTFVSA